MLTLAVANQKGGVGKTTTAVNLGAALAQLGYRVLLVDLDPQAASSAWLGWPNAGNALSLVYMEGQDIRPAIQHGPLPGLDVVPSSSDFSRVELYLGSEAGSEATLRAALSPLDDSYDVALLDCPPNLGRVSVSALIAAHRVLVPLDASALAVRTISQILDTVTKIARFYNERLKVLGLLITKTDATNETAALIAWCNRQYGELVLETRIRNRVRLREAARNGKPIAIFDPSSDAAGDYDALAREVAARAELQQPAGVA